MTKKRKAKTITVRLRARHLVDIMLEDHIITIGRSTARDLALALDAVSRGLGIRRADVQPCPNEQGDLDVLHTGVTIFG